MEDRRKELADRRDRLEKVPEQLPADRRDRLQEFRRRLADRIDDRLEYTDDDGDTVYVFLDDRFIDSSILVALISSVPGAVGDVELWLNSEMNPPLLVANALVDGLTESTSYTLCLDNLLIDTSKTDSEGTLFLENVVKFTGTSISGLSVAIFEGNSCGGEALLSSVVP